MGNAGSHKTHGVENSELFDFWCILLYTLEELFDSDGVHFFFFNSALDRRIFFSTLVQKLMYGEDG